LRLGHVFFQKGAGFGADDILEFGTGVKREVYRAGWRDEHLLGGSPRSGIKEV
jgi:hypothetical protein